MKVVAIVALANFPHWKMCMEKLKTQVDEIYVRVDTTQENKLQELMESKLATGIMLANTEWNRYNWRNELLTMITNANADIVLTPDQDEIYEDAIMEDLVNFYNSDKEIIMCDFVTPMPTDDGRIIPELNGKAYPSAPHCMGFKWKPDITYFPYCGLCQPTNYANNPNNRYYAKALVAHYCMWTKDLEDAKKVWILKEYGCF